MARDTVTGLRPFETELRRACSYPVSLRQKTSLLMLLLHKARGVEPLERG
jgi:hypothetical protein